MAVEAPCGLVSKKCCSGTGWERLRIAWVLCAGGECIAASHGFAVWLQLLCPCRRGCGWYFVERQARLLFLRMRCLVWRAGRQVFWRCYYSSTRCWRLRPMRTRRVCCRCTFGVSGVMLMGPKTSGSPCIVHHPGLLWSAGVLAVRFWWSIYVRL